MGKVRFLSKDSRTFRNRTEAGKQLARELEPIRKEQPVILGIPRGGLIIARELAHALDGDLDIVLSRKLGAPGNPELAIGAVAEDGSVFLNELISSQTGAFTTYIEQEKMRQLAVITKRASEYRKIIPKISLRERFVVITDDGIATGATMQAAVWIAGREEPRFVLVAVPVGSEDSLTRLAKDADEVFCLRVPTWFGGVGQFFDDFAQVEDEEIERILREEANRKVTK
jgi:predicted phosphoribosyltransferase